MLKVKVNNHKEVSVVFKGADYSNRMLPIALPCSAVALREGEAVAQGTIDDKTFECNILKVKEGSFHLIKDSRSYNIEVLKHDPQEKTLTLLVNGNKYNLSVKDKYDELLKSLGFDSFNARKINEVKAPMPGLVIDVVAGEGSSVKKGDTLLVLEAMKMENNIKSPVDGTVKKISVKKGMAVEKNQVLISFV